MKQCSNCKCGDCRFAYSDTVGLECRRYPPFYTGRDYSVFPVVGPWQDWCGEFKRKRERER